VKCFLELNLLSYYIVIHGNHYPQASGLHGQGIRATKLGVGRF
jgi:hypothetical protein